MTVELNMGMIYALAVLGTSSLLVAGVAALTDWLNERNAKQRNEEMKKRLEKPFRWEEGSKKE